MTSELGPLSGITIAEMIDYEGFTGKPIGALFEALSNGSVAKLGILELAGFAYLRLKKDDPSIKPEDVLSMDMSILGTILGEGGNGSAPKGSRARGR